MDYKGKQQWESFARSGKIEDYLKYTQYIQRLRNEPEQAKDRKESDSVADRKGNGSAVG